MTTYQPHTGDRVLSSLGWQYYVGAFSLHAVELLDENGRIVQLARADELTLLTPGPLGSPATAVIDYSPVRPDHTARRVPLPLLVVAVIVTVVGLLVIVAVIIALRPHTTGADDFARTVTAAGIPADAVDASRDAARSFCGLLDTGLSFSSAYDLTVSMGADEGISEREVEAIVSGGVPAYCPTYTSAMQDGLR